MANVDVQNPRLPQFGQASGFNGGISADVYEQYAPQMATTAFQQADMSSEYGMRRDIFEEEEKQLDAKIAQAKRAEELRKAGQDKLDKKAKTGRKVSAAATGATMGAQLGSVVPGVGNVVGGVIGGLGGLIFGNEGGYVPEIHPRSMLYKEFQQGGTVTGYTGEGKFGKWGLQNLRMRETDINRLAGNVDKMGKYGFWDAAMDVGRGYMMGKTLAPKAESLLNLGKSTFGLAKEKGIGSVWDVLSGKTTGLPGEVAIPELEKPVNLNLPQSPMRLQMDTSGIAKRNDILEKSLANIEKFNLNEKVSPVRNTIYNDQFTGGQPTAKKATLSDLIAGLPKKRSGVAGSVLGTTFDMDFGR